MLLPWLPPDALRYWDKVLPGPHGLSLPAHFPFQRSYWVPQPSLHLAASASATTNLSDVIGHSSGTRSKEQVDLESDEASVQVSMLDGAVGDGAALAPVICLHGLCKVFSTTSGGTKVAVDNVDLDIFR